MAEYIKRQQVFDSLPVVTEDKKISLYGAVADFMVLVSAIPAADVVEVVRCENCVSSGGDRYGELICQNQLCPCHGREVDHAFACIYGERRGE